MVRPVPITLPMYAQRPGLAFRISRYFRYGVVGLLGSGWVSGKGASNFTTIGVVRGVDLGVDLDLGIR